MERRHFLKHAAKGLFGLYIVTRLSILRAAPHKQKIQALDFEKRLEKCLEKLPELEDIFTRFKKNMNKLFNKNLGDLNSMPEQKQELLKAVDLLGEVEEDMKILQKLSQSPDLVKQACRTIYHIKKKEIIEIMNKSWFLYALIENPQKELERKLKEAKPWEKVAMAIFLNKKKFPIISKNMTASLGKDKIKKSLSTMSKLHVSYDELDSALA